MSNPNDTPIFEIHSLDGKVWVRPYLGQEEFNGSTYETVAEAITDLPTLAAELGWTEYRITGVGDQVTK